MYKKHNKYSTNYTKMWYLLNNHIQKCDIYLIIIYKNVDATIELDFLIRIKNEIIPIEVKRNRGRAKSLNNILENNDNVNFGLKLTDGNIGFEHNKFTFPYYLMFLLKRFFKDTEYVKWN